MDLCLVCLHQAGHLSFLRVRMSSLGTNKIAAQEGEGWEVFFVFYTGFPAFCLIIFSMSWYKKGFISLLCQPYVQQDVI